MAVYAGVWDNVRKREAQHETLRRLIESGQPLDEALIQKLAILGGTSDIRHDQAFLVTGIWLLPVALGLALFGFILGSQVPDAKLPILGVAVMVSCIGFGCLLGARITKKWYLTDLD